jgi:hypothetical protein
MCASLLEWADPPVTTAIREQAAEIEALHAALQGPRGGTLGKDVSLAELRWGMQLVLSRAFTSTIATERDVAKLAPPPPPPPPSPAQTAAKMWFGELPIVGKMISPPPPPPPPAVGDGLEMAMLPMLDAFNHASNAATSCAYDGERNAFILTTRAPLRRGQQAYLSYGRKSNDELLQLFGFVEEANPHDVVLTIGFEEYLASMPAGLFSSEQAMISRFGLLDDPRLALRPALLGELRATGAPPDMMHALRVLLGSREELEGDARKLATPASLATEERVWTALRGYCKLARSAMGGPRKSDLAAAAVARREGRPRHALALTFRAEKKRLLSELENRLQLQAARSKKKGKIVKSVAS